MRVNANGWSGLYKITKDGAERFLNKTAAGTEVVRNGSVILTSVTDIWESGDETERVYALRTDRKDGKSMKKVKRLITLLLSLALLMTAVPVQAEESVGTGSGNEAAVQEVQADQGTQTNEGTQPDQTGVMQEAPEPERIYPTGDMPEPQIYPTDRTAPEIRTFAAVPEYSTEAELYELLEAEVKEALLAGETEVDISGYEIDINEYKMYALPYFSPYLGMNMDITAYYSDQTAQYVYLDINNSMSVEETKEYFAQVDRRVDEILSVVSDDMTDLEKALVIHDYLVYNGAYDYDNYLNNTIPQESYSSAGLFMKGTGVCNAYAYGFQYLMTKLGIECYVTSSDSMNHAWNIIRLNGNYYHVDCTWDDPVRDTKGQVLHTHFLVSDSKMQNELRHSGWDRTDLVCSDTAYDNAYWVDVETQIVQVGETSYYMADGCLYSRENGQSQMITDTGIWPVWGGGGWWNRKYSGLCYINGYIYYNTYNRIMRAFADEQGIGEAEVFYEPDLSEGYVYGIYMDGEDLKYVIKQSYADSGSVYTVPVSTEVLVERITLNQTSAALTQGDTLQLTATVEPSNASTPFVWSSSDPEIASVDDNGLVTTKNAGNVVITVQAGDVSASCSITVEAPPYTLGDVNSDGTINISDLRLVLRYVCGKVELSEQQKLAGDVATDGRVNIEDLRLILRYICGKISSF